MKRCNLFFLSVIPCILFAIIFSTAEAHPVNRDTAQKAVRRWLQQNQRPMGQPIGGRDMVIEPMSDDTGQTLCYVVNLQPAGFLIVSADDNIEPVIAFSSTGYYDCRDNGPLTTLLEKDMSGRLATLREKKHPKQSDTNRRKQKQHKWKTLTGDVAADDISVPQAASAASVSEVWVDPFVSSLWDQDDVSGSPCYNYYTPNNYPTGCVATAMAQLMRYHSHPTTGIGVQSFTIEVNGSSQTSYTRGGNGSGGTYNWGLMPYDPQSGVTTIQREAIGALCYDAGAAVGMSYTSGGSSASLHDADQQLTSTFKYANSVYTQGVSPSGIDQFWNAMNANLDARLPVLLGISGSVGGHAVIADGYGYTGQTLYHHLNMGWGGSDNAWYQLPLIDANYTFDVIDNYIYNLYPSGSGEIISGRVTNLAGAPLDNVVVGAYYGSTLSKQTTTNSRGVYALTNLTAGRTYRVEASKSGESFLPQNIAVGASADWGTPGNRWGVLFVSANAGPPTAFDIDVDVDAGNSADIELLALDDGQPDPNLYEFQYIITSLPQHGQLSEPNVGPIDGVPYVLQAAEPNGVRYTPCPYFGGQDSFTYKANDGGTYPTGGDSNIATVTVNVNDQLTSDFGVDSNNYLYAMLVDTGFFYDVRSQVIYLPSEVGSAKRITDLAINIGQQSGRALSNFTIRMQHTNKSAFANSAYELLTSGWSPVYQGTLPMTQTGWINFHFDTPFDYNGTQNLMVDLSFNNTGKTAPEGTYRFETVSNDRIYSVGSDTVTHGDPLTWSDWYGKYASVDNRLPSVKWIGEPPVDPLPGDFDASCSVKLPDLAIFSQAWQTTSGDGNYDPACDLTAAKGAINILDLTLFADHWLDTYAF